jgi:hypothetical protein
MGFYRNYVVPWLTHLSMQQAQLVPFRKRVVSGATGQVLEIGIGSGLNLPFYSQNVKQIIGIDPSQSSWRWPKRPPHKAHCPLG